MTVDAYAIGFVMWWIGFGSGALFTVYKIASERDRANYQRTIDPTYDQRCLATQFSDMMKCPCGRSWDVNDPEPPPCQGSRQ